jgi:hypothetical protein
MAKCAGAARQEEMMVARGIFGRAKAVCTCIRVAARDSFFPVLPAGVYLSDKGRDFPFRLPDGATVPTDSNV